jgi:hypothetical protein
MHPHRIIGGYVPVNERKGVSTLVLLAQPAKGIDAPPKVEYLVLLLDKIDRVWDWFKHNSLL